MLHSKGLKGKDVPDVVENEERMLFASLAIHSFGEGLEKVGWTVK